MAFQFTYVICNDPDNEQAAVYKEQAKASSVFQQYKSKMKKENDDRDTEEGGHFIKVGVTDHEGNALETYTHNCHCHSF